MSDSLLTLVVVTNVVVIFIALAILFRNAHQHVIRYLSAFLVSLSLWTLVANVLSPALTYDNNILLVRLAFALMTLAGYFLVRFAHELVEKPLGKRQLVFISIATIAMIFFVFTPALVDTIETSATGYIVTNRQGGYPIFIVVILSVFGYALSLIFREWAAAKRGLQRTQLGVILLGLVVGTIAGVISNVILPSILGSTAPSRYSIIATIIWTLTLLYAVVRHRFLDVRMTIVRSIGYVASVATLAVLYYLMSLFVSRFLISDGGITLDITVMLYNFIFAIFLTLMFQSTKNYFDRVTSSIFYRGSYGIDELSTAVGKVITSSTTLDWLMKGVVREISRRIGAKSSIIVTTVDDEIEAAAWPRARSFSYDAYRKISRHINSSEVVIVKVLRNEELRSVLEEQSIVLLVPLFHNSNLVGLLGFGGRESRTYGIRDIKALSALSAELAVAIQNAKSIQKIQNFNAELEAEVERATADLRATNKRLKQLDQTKDEFISLASHQLRTPLTTIKGYISMLLDGDAGELQPQQRKLLEEAFNSSQRMVHLISDFLNISRIQTGKFALERSDVNLAEILDEEISQLRVNAAARQIELVYDKPSNFPIMPVDEGKIRQVMMNFIDNALYYSLPKTTVKMVLTHTATTVEFKVIDQGIGVPAAEQHKLFVKFSRASNAKKQRPDGTGIGLFMAKKVIVALGGAIIFESKEGVGSTFGFRLNR